MKKPVPRKLKLPPAPTLGEASLKSAPAAKRAYAASPAHIPPLASKPFRPLPQMPKVNLDPPAAPIVFAPIQFDPLPPPPRSDGYREPEPDPPRAMEPVVMPQPPARTRPSKSERRSFFPQDTKLPRDLMLATLGAVFMFLAVMIPAAFGVDLFGFGKVVGVAQHREITAPTQVVQAPEQAPSRELQAVTQRLNQVTERLISLEQSVNVLAERAARAEQPPQNAGLATDELPNEIEPQDFASAQADETAPPPEPAQEPEPAPVAEAAPPAQQASTVPQSSAKADRVNFTIKPGQGVQVKLTMKKGAETRYAWTVRGGLVNYDMQGEGEGNATVYKSRRDVTSDNGRITAAFNGDHGWFWRNSGNQDVIVTLATRGDYAEIKGVPKS